MRGVPTEIKARRISWDERQLLFDGVCDAIRGDSNDAQVRHGRNRPCLLVVLRA